MQPQVPSHWEYFIGRITLLDFEARLISRRLSWYVSAMRCMDIVVVVFAPTSAATSGLAQLSLPEPYLGFMKVLWQVLIWLAGLICVVRTVFIQPRVESLRKLDGELQAQLSSFGVVLDAASYEDIESEQWKQSARKATEKFAMVNVTESFSELERQTALHETKQEYAKYLVP